MRPFLREIGYLARHAAEAVAPGLVFSIVRRQTHELEMGLLADLCDAQRIAIDVGANEGVYSVLLLEHAREVIAFEPNPLLAKFLRRVLGARVRLEEVALSDSAGTATIRIPRYRNGHATMEAENTLAQLLARDEIRSVDVITKRLDDYQLTNVGFIKIDVEGFEATVLAGARDTIAKNRPHLLIEIEERHRHGAIETVVGMLGELGYQGFFYQDNVLHPIAKFQLAKHQAIGNLGMRGRYINNFVFRPRPTSSA